MLQRDSLSTGLPIENSPPGIQTIPAGAGRRAGSVFGTVGAKDEEAAEIVDACQFEDEATSAASPRDQEVFVA